MKLTGKTFQFGDCFRQNSINFSSEGDNDETNAWDCVNKTLGALWSIVRLKEGSKMLEISFVFELKKSLRLGLACQFCGLSLPFFQGKLFSKLGLA